MCESRSRTSFWLGAGGGTVAVGAGVVKLLLWMMETGAESAVLNDHNFVVFLDSDRKFLPRIRSAGDTLQDRIFDRGARVRGAPESI